MTASSCRITLQGPFLHRASRTLLCHILVPRVLSAANSWFPEMRAGHPVFTGYLGSSSATGLAQLLSPFLFVHLCTSAPLTGEWGPQNNSSTVAGRTPESVYFQILFFLESEFNRPSRTWLIFDRAVVVEGPGSWR